MSFDFQAELTASLGELEIEISQEAKTNLERYFEELQKWKKKVNLIAKSASDREVVEKHFVDSLVLVPHLCQKNVHLLDIGTGGGFPGLICKAALPDMQLTLVEPRLKRVSFLRHIVRTLGLTDVEVIAKRLEDVPELCKTGFSHITCRAVTEIGPFFEMVGGLSATGARVVLMKGPKWREELQRGERILGVTPYGFKNAVEYALPGSGARRALLFFEVTQ